jgi:hypothetical protein
MRPDLPVRKASINGLNESRRLVRSQPFQNPADYGR